MGGFAKALKDGLMTFPTGRGAGIRRAIVAGRRRFGRGWLFRWEQPWAGDRLNEEERNQEPDQRAGMGTTHLIPQLSKNGKADLVPDRTGWKSPNYASDDPVVDRYKSPRRVSDGQFDRDLLSPATLFKQDGETAQMVDCQK